MILRRNLLSSATVVTLAAVVLLLSETLIASAESTRHTFRCGASSLATAAFVTTRRPCGSSRRHLQPSSSQQSSSNRPCDDENYFLSQVETTISNVLEPHQDAGDVNILNLPVDQREAFGVARNLNERLQSLRRNNDCPRCWMQRKHCICSECLAVDGEEGINTHANLHRIFLVMHHKEIAMKIDTAKLILSAFPSKCRLVVAGIGDSHQKSMKEMNEAIHAAAESSNRNCLLLFPDDHARTLEDIASDIQQSQHQPSSNPQDQQPYDLIVLDGTWSQARKFVSKYFLDKGSNEFVSNVQAVKLSDQAVEILGSEGSTERGHQLRRHCTSWRQVGTFEATRLFLRDWSQVWASSKDESVDAIPIWKKIEAYQQISNDAALKEVGPLRKKSKGENSKV